MLDTSTVYAATFAVSSRSRFSCAPSDFSQLSSLSPGLPDEESYWSHILPLLRNAKHSSAASRDCLELFLRHAAVREMKGRARAEESLTPPVHSHVSCPSPLLLRGS